MNAQDFEDLLLYYGRCEFFHSMQKIALDGLAKFPTTVKFRLYNGIALVLGNRVQEGIRELNPLKNDTHFGLSALTSLLYAHKKCVVIDVDAVATLEEKLKQTFEYATANAYYSAGIFQLLAKRFKIARDYARKALELDSQQISAVVLQAWADIYTRGTDVSGNLMNKLEQILNHSNTVDATLALVNLYHLRGKLEEAINLLNQLSVRHLELDIPLIVKMEIQFSGLDWDQACESAKRIINLDPTNIAALRVKSLLLIIRDGNVKEGVTTLQQLLAATERVEPDNSSIMLKLCILYARIASRNVELLGLTLRIIDKLVRLNPNRAEYIMELATQHMLLGDIVMATECFRSAIKLENHNTPALCGLTLCQLLKDGNTEHVQQQVQFLSKKSIDIDNPNLLLLKAKVIEKSEDSIHLLTRAAEIHLRKLQSVAFGPKFVLKLNPDFLLQIVQELLRHSPYQICIKQEAYHKQNTPHISLTQCINILQIILKHCPGHNQAVFMRAKVHFLCDEFALASSLLQRIIHDFDSNHSDAYLLISQIHLQQQQYANAMQTLELSLSVNFAVRDNPHYYLLLGMAQRQVQQYYEARNSFMIVLQMLGKEPFIRSHIQPSIERTRAYLVSNFTIADEVTLYLELISTYREIGEDQAIYESERIIQYAMEKFNNTSEGGRLAIAKAEFVLQNANVKKSIELLSAIQPNQYYHMQAKTYLANIYLQYHRDRVAFARCFKELVKTCPQSESYYMLAEAYISIQEPELAIETYKLASEHKLHDFHLVSTLGRAYVKTHQYTKAIAFYNDKLKIPQYTALSLNLAELYLKLRQYNDAKRALAGTTDQTQK